MININFILIFSLILSVYIIQLISNLTFNISKTHPKLFKIVEQLHGFYWATIIIITPLIPTPTLQNFIFIVIFTVIGFIIGGVGLYLLIQFSMTNKHWSLGDFSKSDSEGLYTKGIYGFVRHPGYLGFVFGFIGWSFIWKSVYCIILSPLFLILIIWVSTFEEKVLLIPEFGDEYFKYKKNTPAFFNMPVTIVFLILLVFVLTMVFFGIMPLV